MQDASRVFENCRALNSRESHSEILWKRIQISEQNSYSGQIKQIFNLLINIQTKCIRMWETLKNGWWCDDDHKSVNDEDFTNLWLLPRDKQWKWRCQEKPNISRLQTIFWNHKLSSTSFTLSYLNIHQHSSSNKTNSESTNLYLIASFVSGMFSSSSESYDSQSF